MIEILKSFGRVLEKKEKFVFSSNKTVSALLPYNPYFPVDQFYYLHANLWPSFWLTFNMLSPYLYNYDFNNCSCGYDRNPANSHLVQFGFFWKMHDASLIYSIVYGKPASYNFSHCNVFHDAILESGWFKVTTTIIELNIGFQIFRRVKFFDDALNFLFSASKIPSMTFSIVFLQWIYF